MVGLSRRPLPPCSVLVSATTIGRRDAGRKWRPEGIFGAHGVSKNRRFLTFKACSNTDRRMGAAISPHTLLAANVLDASGVTVVVSRKTVIIFRRCCCQCRESGTGGGDGTKETRLLAIHPVPLPRCSGRPQGQVEGSHRVQRRAEAAGNLWVRSTIARSCACGCCACS